MLISLHPRMRAHVCVWRVCACTPACLYTCQLVCTCARACSCVCTRSLRRWLRFPTLWFVVGSLALLPYMYCPILHVLAVAAAAVGTRLSLFFWAVCAFGCLPFGVCRDSRCGLRYFGLCAAAFRPRGDLRQHCATMDASGPHQYPGNPTLPPVAPSLWPQAYGR